MTRAAFPLVLWNFVLIGVPSDERNDAWGRFGTVVNLARIAPDVDIDVNFYGPTLVPCHVPEARSTFPRLGRSLRLALSTRVRTQEAPLASSTTRFFDESSASCRPPAFVRVHLLR
jgi:hypothetical protein